MLNFTNLDQPCTPILNSPSNLKNHEDVIYKEFAWRTVAEFEGVKTITFTGYGVNPNSGMASIGVILNGEKNNALTYDFSPDGVNNNFYLKGDVLGWSMDKNFSLKQRASKLTREEAEKQLVSVKITKE